ncbi:MAG: 16S rRNA (guanine(527)-N(7))-methyltransferase RsmG [Chitinophagaceae bacterium]
MEIITRYFDDYTEKQRQQFQQLLPLYTEWNQRINVISRKDIQEIYLHHVLHSLSIAAVTQFAPNQKIMDIGTGGGFPGIPLAIHYPDVEFLLVDSIRKKLDVVNAVAEALELKNVKTHWGRAEDVQPKNQFDFVVSRAVAPLGELWRWARPHIKVGKHNDCDLANGLICLKGGDLHQEISESGTRPSVWEIQQLFNESYFENKFVVYVRK